MQPKLVIAPLMAALFLAACGGNNGILAPDPVVSGQGPQSTQTAYLTNIDSSVKFASILTTGDAVAGYRMGGIPDGLGAYDNGDGTITVLMNHELGSTLGVARAHGGIGAYVSEWVINKNTLEVKSGSDLIKEVYDLVSGSWVKQTGVNFNRFCSADLPAVGAFYNSTSGLGTQVRIFLNGEEGGTMRGVAHIATGANKGKSYLLPWAGTAANGAWENLLAHPNAGDKTLVIGNADGGSNGLYLYIGTKQSTGNEIEKAGLIGGQVYRVSVNASAAEDRTTAANFGLVNGATTFSLINGTATGTSFLRPEDGAWDTVNTNRYYFVTTDRMDAAKDGNVNTDITAAQTGRTRLWRLTFTDISRPELGGIIEMLLDGTETVTVAGRVHGVQMLDNLTVASDGTLVLLEDVGNNSHNGKVWRFNPNTRQLTLLAQHDEARFGDYYTGVTGSLTKDEESSGVIEVTTLLGRSDGKRYYLMVVQNHQAASGTNATELVEGGQLILMSY